RCTSYIASSGAKFIALRRHTCSMYPFHFSKKSDAALALASSQDEPALRPSNDIGSPPCSHRDVCGYQPSRFCEGLGWLESLSNPKQLYQIFSCLRYAANFRIFSVMRYSPLLGLVIRCLSISFAMDLLIVGMGISVRSCSSAFVRML